MNDSDESWYDEDAGPVVRLYAVTRGRSGTRRTDVDMVTRVVTSSLGRLRRHEPEYAAIVELTRSPLSVAEIAARLHLPITATKILVGDLIGDGVLDFRAPAAGAGAADDLTVLRAVLKGIQAL
ncbi:DUF742 domain-containing protein [Nocardia otitidiscaviarum]|uniref:DUF742 domain-containing protein n=1 Tax=Nocardia otitidiscaviarum TaxID=1823 RepID=A0A516NGV7_9NOCA|nr:DUF742 domain-containing protein [Nocardia otitidiscaviarum]MBF6177838.1 DUF742 domain-containing protein [Nocardia otitidiscaviarum]MCP9622751.1 DUF742 domain-containing protein [Nocardia otitidiscaviarum]QDP78117.1 DUF742 domain-containing protein [Nocardia otitidiscaviarum]